MVTRAWAAGALAAGVVIVALAGCEERKELSCDINETECRKAVYQTVMRVRGDAFDPFAAMPPIDELTPEQYRERLRAERTAETPEERAWNQALGFLRLIDPMSTVVDSSIEDAVTNTAAYYTPTTKRVTIIKRERDADARTDAMATLAHEFVHAVQDREVNLRSFGTMFDDTMARRALIEGDAMLYELLAVADFAAVSEGRINWDRYFGAYEKALREAVVADENRFFVARGLVYPLGGRYLSDLFWGGGNPAIRKLYPAAPPSSAHYMHGVFSNPRAARYEPCVVNPAGGFTLFGEDKFGAVEVFAYLASGLSDQRAWALALGWTGDRLQVFRNGERTVVVWAIGLGEGATLTDAELAQLAYAPNVRVERRADGLVVTAAADEATALSFSCASPAHQPGLASGAGLNATEPYRAPLGLADRLSVAPRLLRP